MEPRLQRRVQRYGWDKAAPFYDHLWQEQLEPAQSTLLELARIEPGMEILDVACGTGLVTFRAAALAGPEGVVVGTDISEQMVETARDRARREAVGEMRFERAGAERLPFEASSFDRVLSALGLMYVPDPDVALGTFHRVLRPDGRAVAAVWGRRSKCAWAEVFPIIDARVRSDVCPLFFSLGTGEALRQAFAAAGFRNLEVKRLETPLHFRDGQKACDAAFIGGPVALAYHRMPQDVRAEVQHEYLASIAPYRDGDGYQVPSEFVVVAGTK